MARRNQTTLPPELQGSGAERQLPNILGGIGAAAALGPVGLLMGLAAGVMTRRGHKIAVDQWEGREDSLRQMNEEFVAQSNVLQEQFAAEADAGDEAAATNLAQLDELRSRHAKAARLATSADPEMRSLGIEMLREASAGLGGWIEDIETRNEALANIEIQALRAETSGMESTLRAIDNSISDIDGRFNHAATIWNEADNDGQRRAIFDDFMGGMREDFGDTAIATGIATALGAGLGSIIPGIGSLIGAAGGAAAGNAAGQIVSALSRKDVKFDAQQMLAIMTAVHNEARGSADAELNARLQQYTEMNDRLQQLNRFRGAPNLSELIRARAPNLTMREPTRKPARNYRDTIKSWGSMPTEETP